MFNILKWMIASDDPELEVDVSRRRFLQGLGAAAVVAPIAPKIFFAPPGGWELQESGIYSMADLNALDMQYIVPSLVDNVFKASPIFTKLILSGGRTMRQPIVFDKIR